MQSKLNLGCDLRILSRDDLCRIGMTGSICDFEALRTGERI